MPPRAKQTVGLPFGFQDPQAYLDSRMNKAYPHSTPSLGEMPAYRQGVWEEGRNVLGVYAFWVQVVLGEFGGEVEVSAWG